MWVKRTKAEVAVERRRERRGDLWAAAAFGAFILLMVMCLFGWQEAARRGRVTVPLDELLSRLPLGVVAGIILSVVFYKRERKPPKMICPRCEATKYDDGVGQCPCGGRFEKMEAMKYVA
jgi:hypothetical protein